MALDDPADGQDVGDIIAEGFQRQSKTLTELSSAVSALEGAIKMRGLSGASSQAGPRGLDSPPVTQEPVRQRPAAPAPSTTTEAVPEDEPEHGPGTNVPGPGVTTQTSLKTEVRRMVASDDTAASLRQAGAAITTGFATYGAARDVSEQTGQPKHTVPSATRSALSAAYKAVQDERFRQHPQLPAPTPEAAPDDDEDAVVPSGGGQPPAPPTPPSRTPAPGGDGGGMGVSTYQQAIANPEEGVTDKIMGGIKKIPVIGGIIGGIASIGEEVRSQQRKNDFYRSITGADHSEAMGLRVEEELAKAKYVRDFSGEEAAALYKASTAMGFGERNANIQNRGTNDAFDFVVQGKRDTGASVEEMTELLSHAVDDTQLSLKDLADSLSEVSEAADTAGVNTMKARQQFAETMDIAQQQGYGLAAPDVAQRISQTQIGHGQSFEEYDPRTQMDTTYQRVVAAQSGMTLNEYTSLQQTNPAAAGRAQVKTLTQVLDMFTQEQKQWLQRQVRSYGESLNDDPNLSVQIASQFWQTFPEAIDKEAFLMTMKTFSGKDYGGNHIDALAELILETFAGQNQAALGASQQFATKRMNLEGEVKGTGGKMAQREGDDVNSLTSLDANGETRATTSYMDRAKSTGTRSQVMENVLRHFSQEDEKSMMMQVQTRSGSKVVPFGEAVEKYNAQIESGQAKFMGGDYNGENIQKALDIQLDNSKKRLQQATKEARRGKGGTPLDEWYEKHPEDRRPDGGWKASTVKVALTPEAARFFRIQKGSEADIKGMPKSHSTDGSREGFMEQRFGNGDPMTDAVMEQSDDLINKGLQGAAKLGEWF